MNIFKQSKKYKKKLAFSCPICSSISNLHFVTKDFNRKVSNRDFYYYKCSNCEYIFLNPIPNDLDTFYPDNYHFLPKDIKYIRKNSENEKYKINLVKKYKKNGKLLEIGPSYGTFCFLAKIQGFDVTAIEMNQSCCEYLNNVVGINAIKSSNPIESLSNLEKFDVICLWHVIEHIPQPFNTLKAISKKLDREGYLIIAAPNPNSIQLAIMHRFWPHLDAPRHVCLIPINVLVSEMNKLGMELILSTTKDKGSLGWNIFGWEFFFGEISQIKSKRNYLFRILGRIFAYLFYPIEYINGLGSAYTLVFKKVKS